MRAYVRETRGVSWPDPRYRGVRHWRSRTVGVSAFWWIAGWVLLYWVIWPFILAPLWLAAEVWALVASMVWVLWQWAGYPETRGQAVLVKWRWLWLVDLPSEGGR